MSSVNGQKILVTGAGGFIGSHLVDCLVNKGASVTALVHYNSNSSVGWLDSGRQNKNLRIVLGDIRDPFQMKKIVEGQNVIFNLAALIGIPYSYQAPSSYFETNVSGTLNLLEAIRNQPEILFVQMSTSEVYGSARTLPITEEHVLQPQSPYSASKIAAEMLVRSYNLSYNLPIVIVRVFNNYGPRQSRRAIIPTIISQILAGERSLSLGTLDTERDFVFVGDTCEILSKLCVFGDSIIGETINIGSGESISVRSLAEKISSILGYKGDIVVDPKRLRPRNSEVDKLLACNRKLQKSIGHICWTSMGDGLSETICWFQENQKHLNSNTSDYYI